MPIDAGVAEQIVEFLVQLDGDDSKRFEVLFDLVSQQERSSRGLAETLQNAGFAADATRGASGWRCVVTIANTADPAIIDRNCRRVSLLVDEFDCDYSGFRVLTRDAHSDESDVIYDTQREVGFEDDDAIASELLTILQACPSFARICKFERAMEDFRSGRFDKAYDGLWKLCDEDPAEQMCCLPVLGTCRLHQQRYSEAAELFERALMLLNSDATDVTVRLETLVNLGVSYRKLGQMDRALECLQQAVRVDFFCGSAHFQLACFHSQQGDLDRSLSHLREAVLGDLNYIERARVDHELAAVRVCPEFNAIVRPA